MPFSPSSRAGSRSVFGGALRWIALAAALAAFGAWSPGGLTTLLAQPTPDDAAAADDPAAFDAAAGAEPASSAGTSSADDGPREITWSDTMAAAGPIGAVIGLLSLVAVGFIIEHFITIRRARLLPEDVLIDLEQMIHEGRIDEAIEYCDQPGSDSMAAHVVQAGLERFRGSEFGFADYKYAVEEAGEDETGRLYRKTEVLGVVGAIAPMLGLLGTVSGMISAFNTIASRGGTARPDELAGSIGEALVTTFLGLMVAIPCTVFFSFFRNRIDSLVAEAGKRIERVLSPLGRKRT